MDERQTKFRAQIVATIEAIVAVEELAPGVLYTDHRDNLFRMRKAAQKRLEDFEQGLKDQAAEKAYRDVTAALSNDQLAALWMLNQDETDRFVNQRNAARESAITMMKCTGSVGCTEIQTFTTDKKVKHEFATTVTRADDNR